MLCSPIGHLFLHLLLKLLDGEEYGVNLHGLDGLLAYFALQNHALLLILLLDGYVVLLKVLDDHADAVVAVLVHQHMQYPRLPVLNSAPVHCNLVVRSKTVVYFLQSC